MSDGQVLFWFVSIMMVFISIPLFLHFKLKKAVDVKLAAEDAIHRAAVEYIETATKGDVKVTLGDDDSMDLRFGDLAHICIRNMGRDPYVDLDVSRITIDGGANLTDYDITIIGLSLFINELERSCVKGDFHG